MKISLGLNETKVVTVSGARFYYESGAGRIRVKTISSEPGEFDLSPGMGFENKPDMDNFFAIEITNIHSGQQDIEFIISYREVFDNRVDFGELPIDEFEPLKKRTADRWSFMMNRWCGNGGEGTFACVSLRNPVGSTRNCWVRKIFVGAPIVGKIILYAAADMAAVEANAAVSGLNSGDSGPAGKKSFFGPGGARQSVTGNFVCNAPGFAGNQFFYGYSSAGLTVIDLDEPIRLAPGNGIFVMMFEANVPVSANFEIVEEDI